jgi:peroxiredoxin
MNALLPLLVLLVPVDTQRWTTLEEGTPAPAFSVRSENRGELSLVSLLAPEDGRAPTAVVLVFSAVTADPSTPLPGRVLRDAAAARAAGVRVVLVLAGPRKQSAAWLDNAHPDVAVVVDGFGVLSKRWGSPTRPQVVVVDTRGTVTRVVTGDISRVGEVVLEVARTGGISRDDGGAR